MILIPGTPIKVGNKCTTSINLLSLLFLVYIVYDLQLSPWGGVIVGRPREREGE